MRWEHGVRVGTDRPGFGQISRFAAAAQRLRVATATAISLNSCAGACSWTRPVGPGLPATAPLRACPRPTIGTTLPDRAASTESTPLPASEGLLESPANV